MRKTFAIFSLSLSLISCGDAGNPSNVEDLDGDQCTATWWYLEQDGEIVLSGNHAVIQQFGDGIQGFSGDFHDGKDTVVESCGLVSQQDLAVGLHNSLTCIVSTEQGPNGSVPEVYAAAIKGST